MNKIAKVILVIILVPGLLITGCSDNPNQVAQVGMPAPNFQLKNLNGQSVSLSDLQGKPIVINFWATWCSPCTYEMPYLQQIYDEESAKGLLVLAINIGESSAKVRQFIESNDFSFPVLLDTKRDVAQDYNIQYIPSTFFIDKYGIIQEKIIGAFPSKIAIEENLSKIIT